MIDHKKSNSLDENDLASIKEAKNRCQLLELSLKISQLELQVTVLQTYIKYGLSQNDSIEETTGKIARQE